MENTEKIIREAIQGDEKAMEYIYKQTCNRAFFERTRGKFYTV